MAHSLGVRNLPSLKGGSHLTIGAARALKDDFCEFIRNNPRPYHGTQHLSEFLLEWLEHGNAVIEAGGNFGTYIAGLVVIISEWMEDPSILDYNPRDDQVHQSRRPVGVIAPGPTRKHSTATTLRRFLPGGRSGQRR